ncbi:type A chloramphenicol O-acetyltransferase [Clostridium lundense]|uniref:type A chloramphenicol O-acetyltransferase n=1 Tax=Clostridium lundense TaxID=319475 RepID=UPI000489C56F|nr:type A chloramphenicol O-acetyltransferase [Clostridium lundense]
MNFNKIDIESWSRKPYFQQYFENTPCTYSLTANLDITTLLMNIKNENIKLYPTMIYVITTIVNRHQEFRTALDENGNVGIWDEMNPSYTVFQKDSETFSNIWTEYNLDFSKFYESYLKDIEMYGNIKEFSPKPNIQKNTFPISSIPWTTFTGFNLNLYAGAKYLLPIFTMGKYFTQQGKILLPISVQVHHAVCDGFHVARFINECQQMINGYNINMNVR